ncbi:hypothetical protein PoB_000572700 [Plakobranchus ocellatus]|uniref:Uncharacterized protein n=1 Tax=Plakobranchus ocellatus TaxID=259542 RepID=A0AAV3YAS5_9GAST|nr:hypothetical protein PoB_000572700 [Plakobranchus ocellatus]
MILRIKDLVKLTVFFPSLPVPVLKLQDHDEIPSGSYRAANSRAASVAPPPSSLASRLLQSPHHQTFSADALRSSVTIVCRRFVYSRIGTQLITRTLFLVLRHLAVTYRSYP